MSDLPTTPVDCSSPPTQRGQTLLAWLVILGVIGFILWRQHTRAPGNDQATWLVPMQIQARYLVGVSSMGLPGTTGEDLYLQTEQLLNRGSYSQRLRFAILAGELIGPSRARELLETLEADRDAQHLSSTEQAREVVGLLLRLYAGFERSAKVATPALSEKQQATLRAGLGWFGDLALAPEGSDPVSRARVLAPARRTLVGYLVLLGGGLVGLLIGLVLLVALGLFAYLGRLRRVFSLGGTGHGGIYAETFALYLVTFIGIGLLMRWLPQGWTGPWVSGVAMLASLGVLIWPVLRGVSWKQVRQDVGLNLGERPWVEILTGPGCYLSALPGLLVGLITMLTLIHLLKAEPPNHPIGGVALTRSVWMWVQVFLVACVGAPVVEEIMFRGVLYRHLREACQVWGSAPGIALSAIVSSFVFAVIHPQGWLGVPVLMALALAFALAREWRGSLVSPMIAHGINNGISMLVLLLMAS